MKVVAALFLLASCTNARPEVGEGRSKEPRDLKFQGIQPEVANLPVPESSGRKGRQNQLKNGAEIPVHLVYDASHEHETQAVVKEVSIDSLLTKHNEKLTKRVTRSADLPNPDYHNEYDINADDLNRALGIEARQSGEKFDYSSTINSNEDNSDSNRNVIRRIQHYQTFIQPVMVVPAEDNPERFYPQPQMGLLKQVPNKILDDYFPVVFNNPFNAMWSAFTNIVEYGPEAEICKKSEAKSRKKRDATGHGSDYHEFFIEDFSRSGDGGPKIMKLKVKKGGVAIAGPGGIATAGSGGTAIVGPGGTAYTTPDGTAIVGPGGRVIEIPSFPITKVESKSADSPFQIPPGGKVVAHGPVIYYNYKPLTRKPTPVERL